MTLESLGGFAYRMTAIDATEKPGQAVNTAEMRFHRWHTGKRKITAGANLFPMASDMFQE
jgi:hypothetical protein